MKDHDSSFNDDRFGPVQAVPAASVSSSGATSPSQYSWITGDMPDIVHIALIARGGYGEVYKMKNVKTGAVNGVLYMDSL